MGIISNIIKKTALGEAVGQIVEPCGDMSVAGQDQQLVEEHQRAVLGGSIARRQDTGTQ